MIFGLTNTVGPELMSMELALGIVWARSEGLTDGIVRARVWRLKNVADGIVRAREGWLWSLADRYGRA